MRTFHSKCDNTELKNFLNLFYKNIKKNLEEPMKGSPFVFDSVDLLYYKLHEISLNRGGSYTDSPKWLTNKGGGKMTKIMTKNSRCCNSCIIP